MLNARLDEAQAGIKVSGRNISYLRYADEITLMAEGEEELKSFLMKVKEESERAGLKLIILKIKIMASSPITSLYLHCIYIYYTLYIIYIYYTLYIISIIHCIYIYLDRETMETVTDFIFSGAPKSMKMVTAAMKLKDACCLEEKL